MEGDGRKNAAVAVLYDGTSVLMIKRKEREGDPWSGDIAFPGGFNKPDEDLTATARRECLEETGVIPGNVIDAGSLKTFHGDVNVEVYVSRVNRSSPLPGDEVDKAFWVPVNELVEDGLTYPWNGYTIWGLTYRILKKLSSDRERYFPEN